jgi:hypothetical protein
MVLAGGCAGPTRAHKIDLNDKIAARDYEAAAAQVEAAKESEYGNTNAVLYWLDKAAVLHDAGKYEEGDQLLDLAERKMDELYTQSVSRGAATFLLNDGADFYAGQVHERTLLHVLRALNYAYLGKTDDAVVEARKVSAFLGELNDKLGENALVYRDDGFAQYLCALLFEDQGRRDDARIAFETARAAYESHEKALGVPAPRLEVASGRAASRPVESPIIPANLAVAAGSEPEGELVFLHYAGNGPRRESQTIQVAWGDALAIVKESQESQEDPRVGNAIRAGITANSITVALPVFVQDPYLVAGSEIEVGGARVRTTMVEDVTAIARSALATALPRIQAKALTRATIKFLVAKIVEEEAKKRLGSGWGALMGVAMRAGAAATEIADTRGWSTLPAQFRMARVRLPAGTYPVTVHYLSENGLPAGDELIPGVTIRPGRRAYIHVRTAGFAPQTSSVVTAPAPVLAPESAPVPAPESAPSSPPPTAPPAPAAAPVPSVETASQTSVAPQGRAPAAGVTPAVLDIPLPPPPPGTTLRHR